MTVTKDILKTPTLEQAVRLLAQHIYRGRIWDAKNTKGTNHHGLLHGCAKPLNLSQGFIELLANEFDINQTTLLLEEWEKSVGIPDRCVDNTAKTIEERREAVIQRLRKEPIVTIQELQDYVNNLFPYANIILYTGVEYFSFELTFETPFLGGVNEKFVIVAEIPRVDESAKSFEYDFELEFEDCEDVTPQSFEYDLEMEFQGDLSACEDEHADIRCAIERVIPANVVLLILEARDR